MIGLAALTKEEAVRILSLCCTLFVSATSTAAQEPIDADKIAYCMVANSSDADNLVMKELLIAALKDDVPEIKSKMADLVAVMLKVSMGKCGVGLKQMEDPGFEKAAEKYGELIGTKIMQEAIAKIQ